MAPVFTADGGQIRDRLGNLWTIEQATARLHLIADLLADPKETDFGVEVGVSRFLALAAAIRTAKAQGAAS